MLYAILKTCREAVFSVQLANRKLGIEKSVQLATENCCEKHQHTVELYLQK